MIMGWGGGGLTTDHDGVSVGLFHQVCEAT